MGGLTEKPTFSVSSSHWETTLKFFMKPKSFSIVLSIECDHIQGNTVEKDFQILHLQNKWGSKLSDLKKFSKFFQ